MGLIEAYVLISISVGLTMLGTVYLKIFSILKETHPECSAIQHKYTSLVVMTLGATVLAPLYIPILLSTKISARFENTLLLDLSVD